MLKKLYSNIKGFVLGTAILASTALNAQNYTISGTVRNLERNTGSPIENVLVDVDSSSYIAETDANGNYVLNNIPAGNHNIRVSSPGHVGVFKKNYILDKDTLLNVCLADTMQESPSGYMKFNLNEFREIVVPGDPGSNTKTGLHKVNSEFPNSSTWNNVATGNLIPIRLVDATSYDSAQFKKFIGNCNGNWESSDTNSVEHKEGRNIYLLSNNPNIGTSGTRGIAVIFDPAGGNYTDGMAYEPENNAYICEAVVHLNSGAGSRLQKEIRGRSELKNDVWARPSYMNTNPVIMTSLDHMLNMLFNNHWRALELGEQQGTILDMENSPDYDVGALNTNINTPVNGATDLDNLVTLSWDNKFGAKQYGLQIATDENFDNLVLDVPVYRKDTNIVLQGHRTYFARVNVNGGEWSSPINFSTLNHAPSIPTLLTPTGSELINPDEATNFGYTQATDVDNDPISYKLRIWNNEQDTTIEDIIGTNYELAPGFLKNGKSYNYTVASYDGDLESVSLTKQFNTITGIDDILIKGLKVFPNPVVDLLQVEFSENYNGKPVKAGLYSIDGKQLYNGVMDRSNNVIDMSQYNHGTYLFKVGNATKKIIKE